MKFISDAGRPLIIATDMSSPPKMVEKIVASLPTRLVSPKTLLKKKDKINIVKTYMSGNGKDKPYKNIHEKDALASALFAWGKLKSLIERINKKLDKAGVSDAEIRDYVISSVILTESGIKDSIDQYPEQLFNYKSAKIK